MADKRKKPNVVDQATRTTKDTLSAYEPTWRNKLAGFLQDKGIRPDDLVGPAVGMSDQLTIADLIPGLGQVLQAQEAGKQYHEGNRFGGAANLAMAMLPEAGAAKKLLKGAAKPAVAEAERLAAKYGLPEFTTDLTPAQIEANRAAHMAGAKSPPVLYHGTTQWEGDAYNPNRATVNRTGNNIAGFYADERPKRAESYALDWRTNDTEFGEGANVMPVHMAIKNPFVPGKTPVSEAMLDAYATELRASNRHLGSSGEDWVANKVRDAARANHFSIGALNGDGMAYQRVVRAGGYDGLKDGTAWVAFEPTQIKSTMNRGTFDPNEPHLNKAMGGLVKKYGV